MLLSSGSGVAFTIREYVSPTGMSMARGVEPDFNTRGAVIDLDKIKWNKNTKLWSVNNVDMNFTSFSHSSLLN